MHPAGLTGAVIAFNEAINRRDLEALAALMTDDHTFVDSAGGVVSGKGPALEAWEGFLRAFPDYPCIGVFRGRRRMTSISRFVGVAARRCSLLH